MKYIRKITATVLVLLLLVAIAVGLGIVYSVRNINISLSTYYELSLDGNGNEVDDITAAVDYGLYKADYDVCKASLEKFDGRLLSSVSKKDVMNALSDSGYTLVEMRKKMPCTLNLVLKKRMDTFAVRTGEEQYTVYDEDGVYLGESASLNNANDGIPNVLLLAPDGRKLSADDISEIAVICAFFRSEFASLRYIVESIEFDRNTDIQEYHNKITFNMRTGVSVQIVRFENLLTEKIYEAHKVYHNLTPEKKLKGTVVAVEVETNGSAGAHYEP